jgi:nucleotide-binding universal stress UspA family protein
MFPTKILLATDGSAEATRAARMAITLSKELDSELHIVYVEPLPDPFATPEFLSRYPVSERAQGGVILDVNFRAPPSSTHPANRRELPSSHTTRVCICLKSRRRYPHRD